MKITHVYIGGWFQRTMLQLSEIYDYLRDGSSKLPLNKKKLELLHKNLDINEINYGVKGEEYIKYTTGNNLEIKIFEDGLIILGNSQVSEQTINLDIEKVQEYYEKSLTPAINYLFSLGAPVPKELANIKNIYPYFIVCKNATKNDIADLLANTEREKYFEFDNPKYTVVRGDKYYFINNKKQSEEDIARYIEEQVFIREFKGQLHRYLNIHRIIWEKIDSVKERAKVKGADIVKFTSKLEGYAKTINLIDARIKQMSTYLPTRERIAKEDKGLTEFLEISGYRYETLKDTLNYIQYLWSMTQNYVVSAQKLFEGVRSEVTGKSISNLTIVTAMSAGASLIALFTEDAAPEFSAFGFIYFFLLALIGWLANKIINYVSNHQKYDVSDVEYERIK